MLSDAHVVYGVRYMVHRAVFTRLSKVIEELVWFWFYYALWLASVFTLVLVLRQSSENRSKQPKYIYTTCIAYLMARECNWGRGIVDNSITTSS